AEKAAEAKENAKKLARARLARERKGQRSLVSARSARTPWRSAIRGSSLMAPPASIRTRHAGNHPKTAKSLAVRFPDPAAGYFTGAASGIKRLPNTGSL